MVSNSAIRGDGYSEDGCMGSRGARGWFFLGLVLGFTVRRYIIIKINKQMLTCNSLLCRLSLLRVGFYSR